MIRLALQTVVSAAIATALILGIAEITRPSRDGYDVLTCDVLFDNERRLIVGMECPAEREDA